MTEDHDLDQVRTLLHELDLGALEPLDLEEIMRRGDRARRATVTDRLLAVAVVVLVLGAIGLGVSRLSRDPVPPVRPTPTPTPTATSPSPSPTRTTASGSPVVEFTGGMDLAGDVPVAVGFAPNENANSIWALTRSSGGRPGHLWAASPELPGLRPLAEVGAAASGLAVVRDREWVVNGAGSAAGHPNSGTVEEFDLLGRLVHEYGPVPGQVAVAVAALGTEAWTVAPSPSGVVVSRLSAGRLQVLAALPRPTSGGLKPYGIAVTGDGKLAVLTQSTTPMSLQLWYVDRSTGSVSGPTALPLVIPAAGVSLAVQGDRALVLGSNPDDSSTPTLVAVDASGVHAITGCGARPVAVSASADGAWVAAAADGGVATGLLVATVGDTACGTGLRLPGDLYSTPATGDWAGNVLVLSWGSITGVVRSDSPPPGSTLVPEEGDQPAAGVCGAADPGTVTIQANADTPSPRCVQVTAAQNLRVVNTSSRTITVRFADYPARDLAPGASTVFERAFGTFLATGIHRVSLSTAAAAEIWLR